MNSSKIVSPHQRDTSAFNAPAKERKIFLSNMNSWLSNFIIEAMRTEAITDPKITKNIFMGTVNNSNTNLPYLFKPEIITVDVNYHYEGKIFTNDIFIYDLQDSDYNEIEFIVKGLRNLKYDDEKTLVLISSPMTWARTPPKYKRDDDDEDDPEEKDLNELDKEKVTLPYEERDLNLRVPSKRYYHYKMIETLALAAPNYNPNLKVYVICPGFLYGCGEELLYEYFKTAWLQNVDELPFPGDGLNCIPTIHVKDLVSLIKRVIEKRPVQKYIMACDRTENNQLVKIMEAISTCIGNGQVKAVEYSEADNLPAFHEFIINVKFVPTKVFDDKQPSDEDEHSFNKRKFKWVSEYGIISNLNKIRDEFIEYRKLKSQRLFLSGPPLSGKTSLARGIGQALNLPVVSINDIVEYGTNLKDEFGDEVQVRLEELKDKMVEEMEAAAKKAKKKLDKEIDRSTLKPRFPDDLIYSLYKKRLSENLFKNRGFILDGYPRNYQDCVNIFHLKKENDEDPFQVNKELFPDFFFLLSEVGDDVIKTRNTKMQQEKNSTGDNFGATHYTDDNTKKRLEAYKLANESTKGEPSIIDFFKENKSIIEVNQLDGKTPELELVSQVKFIVDKDQANLNLIKLDNDFENINKNSFEQNFEDIDSSKSVEHINQHNFEINEVNDEKDKKLKKKLDMLKEREKQLLEKKSQILRLYLLENVIPTLSQGILEVCKELPEDPVEYLSDYLMSKSKDALKLSENNSLEKLGSNHSDRLIRSSQNSQSEG